MKKHIIAALFICALAVIALPRILDAGSANDNKSERLDRIEEKLDGLAEPDSEIISDDDLDWLIAEILGDDEIWFDNRRGSWEFGPDYKRYWEEDGEWEGNWETDGKFQPGEFSYAARWNLRESPRKMIIVEGDHFNAFRGGDAYLRRLPPEMLIQLGGILERLAPEKHGLLIGILNHLSIFHHPRESGRPHRRPHGRPGCQNGHERDVPDLLQMLRSGQLHTDTKEITTNKFRRPEKLPSIDELEKEMEAYSKEFEKFLEKYQSDSDVKKQRKIIIRKVREGLEFDLKSPEKIVREKDEALSRLEKENRKNEKKIHEQKRLIEKLEKKIRKLEKSAGAK